MDNIPNTRMRKVTYQEFGGRDVLQLVDAPIPEPRAGQVLVKVHGAGLNPIDWKTRKGLGFVAKQLEEQELLPWTPGYDLAGEVVSVGAGVSTLAPGDRVMGLAGFALTGGGYASHALAAADELTMVPENLDLLTAGALPLAALTAWQALFEVAELQAGQKILIHAAAGGVGHLAVQFALSQGAHVIATASAANHDFLDRLGAHEIVDYTTTDVAQECYGLDVVLDLVGSDAGRRSLNCLAKKGVLVTVPTVTADVIVCAAEAMGVRAHGITVRPDVFHLEEIAELIEDGDVSVSIEKVFPLAEVAAAHELLEGGHVRGKLVLDCRG